MRHRLSPRLKGADLVGVGILVVANLLFALTGGGHGAVAGVVASVVVLGASGYAVQAALLAGGADIELAGHVLLSLGISLSLAALGGFVLNWLPAGLTPQAWAILLLAVAVCGVAVAAYRRRLHPPTRAPSAGPTLQWRARDLVAFGLAALMTAGAIALAVVGAQRAPMTTFTQLWLLPAPSNEPNTVQLGVRNLEGGTVTYYLRLAVGSTATGPLQRMTLAPDQTWTAKVTLPVRLAAGVPVEADLFRGTDLTHPYRHVILWPRDRTGT